MTTQQKVSPRRRARECAVQAIYSWHISQNSIEQVELAFVTDQDMQGVDMPYFRKLLRGVVEHIEAVDGSLRPFLDRKEEELIQLNALCCVSPLMNYNLNLMSHTKWLSMKESKLQKYSALTIAINILMEY